MIEAKLESSETIPHEIVDAVRESVINTFESTTGAAPEQVTFSDDDDNLNGIIASIAVFNSNYSISLMMAIPGTTGEKIAEAFLGMQIPFESDDMGDLVGELANILAGDVAANVEKLGFRGQSSLPMTTRGSNLRLFMPSNPPIEKLKFTSDCGDFLLNMAINKSK